MYKRKLAVKLKTSSGEVRHENFEGSTSNKKLTTRDSRLQHGGVLCILGFVFAISSMISITITSSSSSSYLSTSISTPEHETCIVVGVLSRSTEFILRDWQRKEFVHQLGHLPELYKKKSVHIQQRFMVGINSDDSVMKLVAREQHSNGDVMLLKVNEGYRYLTANTWDAMHQLLPILEDPSCKSSFLVKADTDYVLNYKTLTQTILAMPKNSTYFGSMIPNFPTPELMTRQIGSFAQNVMPLWSIGGLYGFSVDIVRHLISYDVERTVLKKEENYIFPEEDRAIGLSLARSNTEDTIKNYLFTKATFHFCSPEHFSCVDYGQFMAFGVGFGESGSGQNKLDTKLHDLERISKLREDCEEIPYEVSDYIQEVDDTFRNKSSLDYLTYGCKALDDEKITNFTDEVKRVHSLALKVEGEDLAADSECAERIYREMFPEVNKFIQNGTFSSGREHYSKIGHHNPSMHYYCPRSCNHDPKCTNISGCNKEKNYLQKYPEVRQAVKNGRFKSGYHHYELFGHKEGRSYECHNYNHHVKEAIGTNEGCYDAFDTFIKKTTPKIKNWPVTGDASMKTKPESCKALLFIDGRDHEWMDFVLRNHRHYTGPEWMLYLVGPKEAAEKWRKRYDGPMVKIVDLPSRFGDLSDYPKQINDLYRSLFLWEEVVECEYVLVTQSDALLLRHGIEDFFKHSYVGAPIYPESHPSLDWRLLFSNSSSGNGGNGGLSLRRRSFMLKSLTECRIPKEGDVYVSEDSWYTACLLESGAPLPTQTMANRFSTGSTCELDAPVGVHKLWKNCLKSTCVGAIQSSAFYHDIYGSDDQIPPSSEYCEEGDMAYLESDHLLMSAFKAGYIKSGHEHWVKYGKLEGRKYSCMYPSLENNKKSPFDVDKKYFNDGVLYSRLRKQE